MDEEIRTFAAGKTTRPTRTRRKYRRDGAVKCVEDLATSPKAGLDLLIESWRPDLAFEAIALRQPESFAEETLTSARSRLTAASVDPDAAIRREGF